MTPSQLIAFLNAVQVGDLAAIRTKLDQARQACVRLDQEPLAQQLGDAQQALERADLKTYRKRLETVISRLGHLR